MKIQKARELQGDEIGLKIDEIQAQLFKLRIQQSIGQETNPMKVRSLRKDIARLKTVRAEQAQKE